MNAAQNHRDANAAAFDQAHSEAHGFGHASPANAGADGHSQGVGHVVPYKILLATGAALIFLTFLTVWIAQFDFGRANIWVAMGVATIKASLVLLFFMHLRWDRPFNAFIFVASLAFVALFIIGSMSDVSENAPWHEQYREIELQNGDSKAAQAKLNELPSTPPPAPGGGDAPGTEAAH